MIYQTDRKSYNPIFRKEGITSSHPFVPTLLKSNGVGGIFILCVFFIMIAFPTICSSSENGITAFNLITNDDGSQKWSISIQILVLMTVLTMLPALLLLMTAFTRVVIILSILRQALGMPQTPSNQILIGISFFLTFFIMSPVLEQVYDNALLPYMDGKISSEVALENAEKPIRMFMLAQTRANDIQLFSDVANIDQNIKIEDVPLKVLIPSFVSSELKTAFEIGFLIFIPFLVIDLVVASVLMSMGMMMLSPLIISLPFKIMLFVLVDGWNLTLGTIASSFEL